jgi:uncharacterized protein (DUF2235 family)
MIRIGSKAAFAIALLVAPLWQQQQSCSAFHASPVAGLATTRIGSRAPAAAHHRLCQQLWAKKILVCFDGSGNSPNNAFHTDEEIAEGKDGKVSNVLKIHVLAGGSLDNTRADVAGQRSLYYTGVGTRGDAVLKKLRFALALLGPQDAINEAKNDLKEHYEPGDLLYVFGFSRGSATARLFCSQLADEGLEIKGQKVDSPPVEFLGCFDTVADFGIPTLKKSKIPKSGVLGEKDGKIAHIIRQATHLLSLDDLRVTFSPTLMGQEEDRDIHEVWFPGSHSGVGGGWGNEGLSDGACVYMMERASGLAENALTFIDVDEVVSEALLMPAAMSDTKKERQLTNDNIRITPDLTTPVHDTSYEKLKHLNSPRSLYVVKDDKAVDGATVLISDNVNRKKEVDKDYKPNDNLDKVKIVFVATTGVRMEPKKVDTK